MQAIYYIEEVYEKMSCSGFYFALHRRAEWLKREKKLKKKGTI
jgi:hypothetical protein